MEPPTAPPSLALHERVELRALRRAVILGAALEGVRVEREVAGSRRHLEGAVAAIVDRGQAAFQLRTDAALRHELGNAAIDGVNDATDRLAAVAQRGRPAYHLDLVGAERVDGNRMVFRQVRNIMRGDAVLLDAHPVVVEAADDGTVGAGGEGRAGDAGLLHQRIGERLAATRLELARRRHRDRHEGVVGNDAAR
jgi:hypothetical protein